ncbi:Sulfhydryl oxidase [Meloidogyne graminicola]|uniref:Sulfhydryl oxidase n=1 Tax=Meloidogyne graminicola TaxID=189291 RepID=A0A8S9ZQ69_9BILA|nr:Sulfhydryl oxidase [Meloidogyne graminicola]
MVGGIRSSLKLSASIYLILLFFVPLNSKKASISYVPQGSNPLLYQPGIDSIVHLDQETFSDTVFESDRGNSFVVEFYADWCGHCRAFAPSFKKFASLTKRWSDVVKIGAVNCADSFNSQVCRSNSVAYFPMLKYFPRKAQNFSDGQTFESAWSGNGLRDILTTKVLNEYKLMNYEDWPNLNSLQVDTQTTFEDLWAKIEPSSNFLLIIFEEKIDSPAIIQSILDLWPNKQQIGVRRASATSPLVSMLGIEKFPYVALFKRGNQQSIFMEEFKGPITLDEAMQRVQPGQFFSLDSELKQSIETTKRPVNLIDCEKSPEKCKLLYFVSETDMLKTVRMAILDEVTFSGLPIEGDRFRKLYAFISLLTEYFPTKTFNAGFEKFRNKRAVIDATLTINLRNSERAKQVFVHLRQLLESKISANISVEEWRNQFESVERVYGYPFVQNSTWQHCAGSSIEFRGYTCGLWTTFHALTANVIITHMGTSPNPMGPLRAIQGWVTSFFGCEHCRQHFMKMTTQTFPMNEQRVSRLNDMLMYLWRAHNIVNARLHGSNTEDPQFPKYQFPPLFLCPKCHSGGHFSRRQTRNFLISYYGSIRPYRKIHSNNIDSTKSRSKL